MSLTCLNVNLHDNPRSGSFGRKWKFSCGNNFIDVPANTNKIGYSYLQYMQTNKSYFYCLYILISVLNQANMAVSIVQIVLGNCSSIYSTL
jgi:hypothetical protein